MEPVSKNHDQTRDRILDEAERLFAEQGFDSVSVRQITTAAEVNLAAVNYHFGNKHNLYLEVFRSRWLPRAAKVRTRLAEMVEAGNGTPEEVIKAVATSFFSGFDEAEVIRHRQLMAREMANPGEAFDLVVKEAMHPIMRLVAEKLYGNLNSDIDSEKKLLSIWSIFSQVLYFQMIRLPVIKMTGRKYDEEFKQVLIDHVTAFSLHGLGLDREGK